MRHLLQLLLLLAGIPVCQTPAQQEPAAPSPAQEAALRGEEPWASLQKRHLPLIPTQEEINALSQDEFNAGNKAIKLVLLRQLLQARHDGRRVTPENLAACAQMAKKLKAPASFALLLEASARDDLSPRERYALSKGLETLYEHYRVDLLSLRYFIEGSHLPEPVLQEAASWLPMEDLFNLVKLSDLTPLRVEADFAELRDICRSATDLYASIHDREQAEETAPQLLPLLARFARTAGSRHFAPKELQTRLLSLYKEEIQSLSEKWQGERQRLKEANYYDSAKLRIIDYLFD